MACISIKNKLISRSMLVGNSAYVPAPSSVEYLVVAGGGGGGAGPSSPSAGASGGSGIVVLRYSDTYPLATSTTGSPTVTTTGGFRIYTYTGSGTITF